MSGNHLVIIAASGRSGTTWIQNILAAPLTSRFIFEPLHPRVTGDRSLMLNYLERDDTHHALRSHMDRAIHGKLRNRWTNQGGREELKYFYLNRWWAKDTVVKLICGNLSLEWLQKNFDARIVFMVRHPCAVIASKIKLGWGKGAPWKIEHLMSQETLVEKHLEPYRDIIEMKDPSHTQMHALLWCMENKPPLNQFKDNCAAPDKTQADGASGIGWTPCVYEYLYRSPGTELERIFSGIGIPLSARSRKMVNNVSHTTRSESAMRTRGDILEKWRKELSEQDVREIMEIVDAFEMGIYDNGSLPVSSEVERYLGVSSPL